MNKYKIYVYAICKNESKFVSRWYTSMSEADGVFVLDTGSDDGTPEMLEKLGATVHCEEINPWRFDTARNKSLDFVPEDADICVCTDLDEVFVPGWRTLLENRWKPGLLRVKYRYVWNFNQDGSEGNVFYIEKIHARHGFRWEHPVHEVLRYDGREPAAPIVPGMCLEHHADDTKSRAQYLPLLEQSVLENPQDDRNVHYLGREYMYYKKWDYCINMLLYHLSMPTSVWADERCASMRFLARAYKAKDENTQAYRWLLRACAEAPHLREPWTEAALFCYETGDYSGCASFAQKAVSITERPSTYITEAFAWGALPYDLLGISLWLSGDKTGAVEAVRTALTFSPDDERLLNNLKQMEKAVRS